MKDIIREFAVNHWIIFSMLAWWAMAFVTSLGYGVIQLLTSLFYRLPNRIIRSRMVLKHGWPPSHLDADGDSIPLPKPPKINRSHAIN